MNGRLASNTLPLINVCGSRRLVLSSYVLITRVEGLRVFIRVKFVRGVRIPG